ncbi:MAG: hypothetical protein LBN27_12820 [Prevotellaceae bacterium]|nr:hypothetical protein [Prevotellaceae bacterium]
MNFSKPANDFLLSSLSRRHTDQIALWATESDENFEELYQLIFAKDPKTAWRAAWAVEKVCERQPERLAPKLAEIIAALPHFRHDGSKRSLLLVILRAPLPEPIPVELINLCFEWLVSPRESVAVQVNCLKVLDKIARREPDLQQEIALYLSGDLSEYSVGYRTAARNWLKSKKYANNADY